MTQRTYAIELTIPDNTAFTALVTLQRLGIACDEVRRADIYRFDVDDDRAEQLDASIRQIETIFNPNKHVLRAREPHPQAGEVWIADRDEPAARPAEGDAAPGDAENGLRIAGRQLAGVHSLRRMTAWRLRKDGRDVPENVLAAAVEGLLCNSAFQKAIR
jgi:phosphoribosylformylglycinamidine (FGAM) synthase PurS component